MIINLEWDANALAAPQSFRTSVQAAADILDRALSDPITVNVTVGYGEIGLGTPQYEQLDSGVSLGGSVYTIRASYPALLASLRTHETSPTQAQLLASLPHTAALNGQQTFFVSNAQAKALGAFPADGTGVDGQTGFPASFTGAVLTSAAITEIVHAMGLSNGGAFIESLDSYTSAGVHYFGSGSSAYFSLDGGNTSLAPYDVGFDNTLFTGVPTAVLNTPTSGVTTLSPLDLQQLSAEGFNTGVAVAPPPTGTAPATAATSGANTVVGQNVRVPAGQAISARSMIKSVAVHNGDAVTDYEFSNAGTDGGSFSIGGVAIPAGQSVFILANQLDQLQYTGPARAGTDTVQVFAFTANTAIASQGAALTVTAFTRSAAPYVVNDLGYSAAAAGANHVIDLPNFEASFPDLIRAFGTNTQAMANWYAQNEPVENRAETFNGLDYVASYKDLIAAFGQPGASMQAVLDAGAGHFISSGLSEGRSTTFNALDYIASYADLTRAFGTNADAGAMHFIHSGVNEGRSVSFDGLDYIASYRDLISAFGANEQAGAAHYIQSGMNEHRQISFDGLAYIASYTDLMQAFGANNDAGAVHYIQSGVNEQRTTTFDVQGYEAAHPDLVGAYSSNDAFLTAYINTYVHTGHLLT